jgi:multidrug efflux pump subunit AcrB
MSLSEISIKRPVFAWMLMASLIVFGGISFNRMGMSLLPDVDFPVISVGLSLLGAAPEVMETDVVDVVENSLSTIQGVQLISSTSRKGSANVTIQLDLDRDVDLAMQDVQAKISESHMKSLMREVMHGKTGAVVIEPIPDECKELMPAADLGRSKDRQERAEMPREASRCCWYK